jgi:hypothetical protein
VKPSTRSIGCAADDQPGASFYRAAGHDKKTAEALAGLDAMCATHAKVRRMARALPRPSTTCQLPHRGSTRGAGRPAVRGASRRSSARSGDSGDGEGSEPPQGRRVNRREAIGEWSTERKAILDALVRAEGLGRRQLGFEEGEAA